MRCSAEVKAARFYCKIFNQIKCFIHVVLINFLFKSYIEVFNFSLQANTPDVGIKKKYLHFGYIA